MLHQELAEFQKDQINRASRFRHTIAEIQQKFNYPHFTITSIIMRIETHYLEENKECIGCSQKFLNWDKQLLIWRALDNAKMSLCKLKFATNLDLLIFTIRYWLREENITKWLSVERHQLTKIYTSKHFDFAKKHLNSLVDNRQKCILLNKYSVVKGVDL